jgi:hypothetical protein
MVFDFGFHVAANFWDFKSSPSRSKVLENASGAAAARFPLSHRLGGCG